MSQESSNAAMQQNGLLAEGRIYIVEVDKGAWDDWSWGIAGVYDCPHKADEAKRRMLACYAEDKRSKDYHLKRTAKSVNEVRVTEWKLNDVPKSPFS
jgi:hypothetical protein